MAPQPEWDFSTALSDADAFGVMGREGLSFSTRWGGPDATDDTTRQPHPNVQAIKLYTTTTGRSMDSGTLFRLGPEHQQSGPVHQLRRSGCGRTTMTIMVLNKDPGNTANVTFNLNGFSASTYSSYTLGLNSPRLNRRFDLDCLERDAELLPHTASRCWWSAVPSPPSLPRSGI